MFYFDKDGALDVQLRRGVPANASAERTELVSARAESRRLGTLGGRRTPRRSARPCGTGGTALLRRGRRHRDARLGARVITRAIQGLPAGSACDRAARDTSDREPTPFRAIYSSTQSDARQGVCVQACARYPVRVSHHRIRKLAVRVGSYDRSVSDCRLAPASREHAHGRSPLAAADVCGTCEPISQCSLGDTRASRAICLPVQVRSETPSRRYGTRALSRDRQVRVSSATATCSDESSTAFAGRRQASPLRTPRRSAEDS